MADYAEDAVLITPDGALKGHAQIRSLFAQIFANTFPPDKTSLNLSKQVVEDEIAYILWSGSSPHYNAPLATDTFVMRDGKIVAQTFAATEMRAPRAAVARATNAPESACVRVSIAGSCSCRQTNRGQSGQSTFSLVTGPTFLSSRQDANAKKVLYFLGAPFDAAQDMLYAFARVTFSFLSILVAA